MAQRIIIRVLGNTLAPYSASVNLGTNISEDWHVNVTQLGRGRDTSTAQRALYPNAQSYIWITQQSTLVSNQVKATKMYINITSAAMDALANA